MAFLWGGFFFILADKINQQFTMEITADKLEGIIQATAELTVKRVLRDLGLTKKNITQNQAEKIYGRKNISIWRSSKDIKPVKIANRIYYNRDRLDELSTINKLF